jgi:hypothetical protein
MSDVTGVLALDVGGIHVPDAGPMFFAALAVHVTAGITAVVAGLLAATARKQPGRHPRAGTVYLYAIAAVFLTATVMATLRWRHDWHLFVIATVAFALAAFGWWTRRRRRQRWMLLHGSAMAGSYITLYIGFYVDNGPQLPVWDRLPHFAYWLVPAAIGIPLTWRALRNNGVNRRRAANPARRGGREGRSACARRRADNVSRPAPVRSECRPRDARSAETRAHASRARGRTAARPGRRGRSAACPRSARRPP